MYIYFLITLCICLENMSLVVITKKVRFLIQTLVMDLCQNVQKLNFEMRSKLQEHSVLFSAIGHTCIFFSSLRLCLSNIMVFHCALLHLNSLACIENFNTTSLFQAHTTFYWCSLTSTYLCDWNQLWLIGAAQVFKTHNTCMIWSIFNVNVDC
jgi:hypothetical protein